MMKSLTPGSISVEGSTPTIKSCTLYGHKRSFGTWLWSDYMSPLDTHYIVINDETGEPLSYGLIKRG